MASILINLRHNNIIIMKKLFLILSLFTTSVFLVSCEDTTIEDVFTGGTESPNIAEGLKEALKVGTDTAVARLNITDGYFADAALKLLLPPQGEAAISKMRDSDNTIVQGLYTSVIKSLEDDMILSLNRAAEDAASEAAPIFVDAITGITIDDANDILFGGDTTAATKFLKNGTLASLTETYSPKIDASLDKKLVGNTSTNDVWDNLVGKYNGFFDATGILGLAQVTALNAVGLNKITDTDLSDYATEKALDGLFVKVSEQESKIRNDPFARVSDLLQDVFSLLD